MAGAEESTAVAKGRSCRKIIRSAEMGGPLQYKVLKRPRYGIKHVCWWPFAGFWISQDNRSATANYAESLMAAGRKRIILIGSPIPNPLTDELKLTEL